MEKTRSIHPVLSRNYAIFTPPIAEFGEALQRWAADRLPGALVTGYTRTGKTTAIMHWAATLLRETEGQSLPVFLLNALDRCKHLARAVVGECLSRA